MRKYPGVKCFTFQPPPKHDVESRLEGGNNQHLYHLPYTELGGGRAVV